MKNLKGAKSVKKGAKGGRKSTPQKRRRKRSRGKGRKSYIGGLTDNGRKTPKGKESYMNETKRDRDRGLKNS